MTVKEVLDKLNRMKPNTVDNKDKYDWLNELDGIIHERIYSRAADYTEVFTPYEYDVDNDRETLIPIPYTEIYLHFLSAKIDADNGEFISYNNNMYNDFAAYYRRNHMPRGY